MHRMEKARADETEALATDIIRSMTTGLVSLDDTGRVTVVNPAAEENLRCGRAVASRKVFSGSLSWL